jgi:hypothetical protein
MSIRVIQGTQNEMSMAWRVAEVAWHGEVLTVAPLSALEKKMVHGELRWRGVVQMSLIWLQGDGGHGGELNWKTGKRCGQILSSEL